MYYFFFQTADIRQFSRA